MKNIDELRKVLDAKNFFKSILNKNYKDNFLKTDLIKSSFIMFFILLISIVLITTGVLGYYGDSGKYIVDDRLNIGASIFDQKNWSNLSAIPTNIRMVRAVFDLSIVWFLFFYLYSVKIGLIYLKRKTKIYYSILFFLSFIPIIDIFFLVFNSYKNFDKDVILYQIRNFFRTEDYLKDQFKFSGIKRKLVLAQWIIYLPLIPTLFIPNDKSSNNWDNNFWFYTISFFTLEGNLMVFLLVTLLLFFPGWQIFKNNLFQVMATCYITIITSFWCLILLPNFIVTETFPTNPILQFSSIWAHIVTPWTFIGLSIFLIRSTKKENYDNLTKMIVVSAIYPLMYTLYISILPFNTGVSIYSWVTNLNPNLAIFINYKNPDVKYYGTPLNILWLLLANIIFSVVTFFYAYISRNAISKFDNDVSSLKRTELAHQAK